MAWSAAMAGIGTAILSSPSLSSRSGPRLTHRACHHAVFVEAALERAIEERRAPAGLEPDQFRQTRIAAQQKRGPAGEALLERIAEPRVELRQRIRARESNAV